MRQVCRAALAVIVLAQLGCGAIQRPSWNKPWGRGAVVPAVVCGLIAGGVGAYIQEERRGTSAVDLNGQRVSATDPGDHWKGVLIGVPIGAVVCGVLGHVFLDPTPEEAPLPPATPPPPPPTPEPTPTVEVPVEVKKRIVLRGVFFDFDRAEIRPDGRPVLDEAVRILGENPEVRVVVEGHTDAKGTDDYNQALSIRRAEAVFRYLVNQGVAPERLRVEGHGESRPVATNATESGRAQNRRVELRALP